jgi:hypothetical protein
VIDTTESSALRILLQGIVGCGAAAGGATGAGPGSCASGGAGASAAVVLNMLVAGIDKQDRIDTNGDGSPDAYTLETQQARTNLIATLTGILAGTLGGNAGTAAAAAQVETENNSVKGYKPSSCRDTGTGDNCFTPPELIQRNQPFFDAGIIDRSAFVTCVASPLANACRDGRTTVLDKLAGANVNIREQLNSLSDTELAQRYATFENLKLDAFTKVNQQNRLLLPYLEAHPEVFATLSPADKATYALAYQWKQENYVKAVIAAGPFGGYSSLDNDFQVTVRTLGVGQAMLGGAGAFTSFAAAAAVGPACITIIGCAPTVGLGALGLIEIDQTIAGVRTAINGAPVNSFAAQGLSAGANAIGIPLSPNTAEFVVGGTTFVGVIVGGRLVVRGIKAPSPSGDIIVTATRPTTLTGTGTATLDVRPPLATNNVTGTFTLGTPPPTTPVISPLGNLDDILPNLNTRVMSGTDARALTTPNRGVIYVQENASMSQVARDFQAGCAGAFCDIASRSDAAPSLRYDNTVTNGVNYIRFDGIERSANGQGIVLIDRKTYLVDFNPRADTTALTIRRVAEAVRQNLGYQVVYEFPNQAALRKADTFIAGLVARDPRLAGAITTRVAGPR